MADQLYLSYWVRGFSPLGMLRDFEKMLAAFPYSKLSQAESAFRIYAVAFSEQPVIEIGVRPQDDLDPVVKTAQDFQNADASYELTTAWDLWQYDEDWKLGPSAVQLTCFGPEFDNDIGDHLRIGFGLDSQFLPDAVAAEGLAMIRANIQSLLRLVKDMDGLVNVERRQLWSEGGGNFADRLQEALLGGSPKRGGSPPPDQRT